MGVIHPGTNILMCHPEMEPTAPLPPCQAQWCTPGALVVSGQIIAVIDVCVVDVTTLDSPFLNPQSSEAGRWQGHFALAKQRGCWAGWTGPAIQLVKARFVKSGYQSFAPSCCS